VVADCAAAAGWSDIVFFDDRLAAGSMVARWGVAGRSADLLAAAGEHGAVIVGIGDNRTRLHWQDQLTNAGAAIATIIHPRAVVSANASIGAGSVVVAGAVINIDAAIGAAAIINTGATIDHDCVLEEGVHVSPGANLAGEVRAGRASWIGIGAAIREGVRIGADVRIGAGAVVIGDVADGLTVVGNPARIIERQ